MAGAKEEERQKWQDELWAPPAGRNPDRVTQDVVDEEMSLFMALNRQTSGGGDL